MPKINVSRETLNDKQFPGKKMDWVPKHSPKFFIKRINILIIEPAVKFSRQ